MSFRSSNSVGSVIWFLRLWLFAGLLVAMLALFEIAFLAATGHSYRSKEHIEKTALRDLSIIDSLHRVAVMYYRQRDGSKPIQSIVKLHDGSMVPRVLLMKDVEPYRVAMSEDRRLTASTMDGEIFLWELASGSATEMIETQEAQLDITNDKTIDNLLFSAGGRFLAATSSNRHLVWDADSRTRVNENDDGRLLFFFPSGARVLIALRDGHLAIRDLTYPGQTEIFQLGEHDIVAACISPNSQYLLATNKRGELLAWSLVEQRILWTKNRWGPPQAIGINDDFAVFVGRNGSNVLACKAATGTQTRTVHQLDHPVQGVKVNDADTLYAWDSRGRLAAEHLILDPSTR